MSELQPSVDGGTMAAHDNVGSKRHRRPSVRLGDIGGSHDKHQHQQWSKAQLKSTSNKASKNRQLTNLSSNQTLTLVDTANPNDENTNSRNKMNNWGNVEDQDDNRDASLDNVVIGSWKSTKRGPKTKRLRSNWATKAKEVERNGKLQSTDVEDLDISENSEHSPVHSCDDDGINDNVRKSETRVSEEGPTDTETPDWNCGLEKNGVRVWLNQLGLGRYASLFEIHEVDDEVLPMLTLEDLKDMGINAVGSRRKMYCSIQKLNKGFFS